MKMTNNSDESSWIGWYCSLSRNEFMCQVDEKFIWDKFNLNGLYSQVEHYQAAINRILDLDAYVDPPVNPESLQKSAELLYGLIHARYILTSAGLLKMLEKYHKMQFGRCPRVYCDTQPLLPVGLSDTPNVSMVKLYCPKCSDVYHPPGYMGVDGAYFGTAFPHMVFMAHPKLRPQPPTKAFVPRVYGFKIHPSAYKLQGNRIEEAVEDEGMQEVRSGSSVVSPQASLSKVLTKVMRLDYKGSDEERDGF